MSRGASAQPSPTDEEVVIESLAAGGDGVGHLADGRVVFVPETAPGDRVRVERVEEHARFARGRLREVLRPGAGRVEPPCPVFGTCGGCAWQHIAYEEQVRAKAAILRDAFERLGGLAVPDPLPFTPSPSPYAYRARARVRVEGGRAGFRQRRSHALCAVERCPVLTPPLEDALRALSQAAARGEARPGEWELAAGDGGSVRRVRLGAGRPARSRALWMRTRRGALRISPGVFAQAHAGLADALVDAVVGAAAPPGAEGGLALELFAGAGLLTLGLVERFDRVVAVESHPAAARDLAANLAAAGALPGAAEVCARRSESLLASWDGAPRPDAVVLDPPRAGLGRGGAAALARLRPRRVAYLACDPATLARDCAALVADGYALTGLRGFDLFPQTPHVEALAQLELRGAGPAAARAEADAGSGA